MEWTTKYMDASLFYEAWKTKFIEKLCVYSSKLISEYENLIKEHKTPDEDFVKRYLIQYAVMLNVLKRKLKADGISVSLATDVIFEGYKTNLIKDKSTFFDVIKFRIRCHTNPDAYSEFKPEYITIMKDFIELFKTLAKNGGNRTKDYLIYDNSCCLWGLKKKYYNKIIKCFLEVPGLKIVRIFGSRVTADFSDFSDIDMICEGTYTPQEYAELMDKIYSLELPYVIDIYDINRKSRPFMYRNVVRSNIFYERKNYVPDDYVSVIN